MKHGDVKLVLVIVTATLLSWLVAQWIARRYRRRMAGLMRAGGGSDISAGGSMEGRSRRAFASVDEPARRRRLLALLIGMSALIALTQAGIDLLLLELPLTPRRLAVLAVVYLWPLVPVLAVWQRWGGWKMLFIMTLVLAAAFVWVMMNSTAAQTRTVTLAWLLTTIGPSTLVLAALTLSPRARVIAPWIWLPLAALALLSVICLDVLEAGVLAEAAWARALAGTLGALPAVALMILLPWAFALPVLRLVGRAISLAYVNKRLSELMVLFTAIWGVALSVAAIIRGSGLGLPAAALLLPLLWIPMVMAVFSVRVRAGRPPTLLVLRVFQRDVEVQTLFDQVIERWRLVGNTVMIAGTDLAERTMNAADVFTFIAGRLDSRFIRSAAQLDAQIARFDMEPDAEGRYRVNECYCADQTWQLALNRLLGLSDVVLMDLRSFVARNAGCAYELQALASVSGISRVLVLTDQASDLALARTLTSDAPDGRFVWMDEGATSAAARQRILDAMSQARA